MAQGTHDTGRILDKIAKLLALAGNNPNQHEAAAAAAQAAELMRKYNVESHDLEGRLDGKKAEVVHQVFDLKKAGGGNVNWRRLLYFGIAKNNFCQAVILSGNRTHTMGVVGEAHNLAFVDYLYTYLANAFWNEAHSTFIRMKYREHRVMPNGNTWKDSFAMGAMQAVVARLANERKQAMAADNKTNAIIRVQDKIVTEAFARIYTQVRTGGWMGHTNRGDMAEALGRRFGNEIGLNRPIEEGKRNGVKQLAG